MERPAVDASGRTHQASICCRQGSPPKLSPRKLLERLGLVAFERGNRMLSRRMAFWLGRKQEDVLGHRLLCKGVVRLQALVLGRMTIISNGRLTASCAEIAQPFGVLFGEKAAQTLSLVVPLSKVIPHNNADDSSTSIQGSSG